ncbi:hypothetical protein [Sphingopyxis sp. LC81]|uniref:hypothetical protein n=1 Tax=Sphingopyxis sp. LC81 TaxID=1502850 RepID=UPI00126A4923|nr:hypothetical protein [Sphingopyxis sp. LC81]
MILQASGNQRRIRGVLFGHDRRRSRGNGAACSRAHPHAALIAGSYAENNAWSAGYVLLAALAERVRSTGSLGYLDEDQLLQVQLHFSNHALSSDEWKDVKDAVWAATLSDAHIFERFARLLFEPSLAREKEHVAGSHELLTDGAERHPKIVSLLAAEWLERFPDMHSRPEAELMDVLLSRGHCTCFSPDRRHAGMSATMR